MARYTIELGTLIKSGYYPFDDTWSTFEANHKRELEQKIIGHYYFNEIGAETPDRFRHYLNQHLREIMPYYNALYRSTLYDLAPLYNMIVEREIKGNTTSNNSMQQVNRQDSESLKRMGESINTDFVGDEWSTKDTTQHGVKSTIGNLTGNHTENEGISKTGTEDWTKNTDKNLDETTNRVIKEDTVSKEIFDGEGTSKTTGTETETTNGTKRYSDTPQGEIVVSSLNIDAQFLTNYEQTTGNRNRNYSENGNTTTDNVTDFTKTIDTNDNFTRNVTEHDTEVMDRDTTERSTRDRTNKDIEDTTGFSDETVTTKEVGHTATKNNEKKFSDSTENDYSSQTGSTASSGESTSKDTTTVTEKSNIGVSRSRLIQEYRDAILNIDLQIIQALATNFMGVF